MATRHYASSYTGAEDTFVRSYLSTTAHTPLTSYSTAYEGTYGGYTGNWLKDTSTVLHGFAKVYASEVPYTAVYNKIWVGIALTNYTKQWAGNTSFMGGLEYLKAYAQDTFINFASVFSDATGNYSIGLRDYNKSYVGDVNYEGAATYTTDGNYSKTYTKIYTTSENFAGSATYTKIWSKDYTAVYTKIWSKDYETD